MLTTGRAIRIITADTTTESPMASGNRYRMMERAFSDSPRPRCSPSRMPLALPMPSAMVWGTMPIL